MATTPRRARWWAVAAGLVAAGACATALAGSVPASSYLLSVKNLPRGFYVKSQETWSAAGLNTPGPYPFGSCALRRYVHFTSGARIVFGIRNQDAVLEDHVNLGATVKATRLDTNKRYAQIDACHTIAIDGVTYAVAPTTAMHTISNGARVGVLVLTTTFKGFPWETGIGIAWRGHAELSVEYGPVSSADGQLANARTLSFTLLAVGRLPRH